MKSPRYFIDMSVEELFCWKDVWFPVYCCYELALIQDRALFRSCADMVVAVKWNKDILYFTNIVESLTLNLHCYCIQADSSDFGNSRVISPTKTEVKDIIRTKGGRNSSAHMDVINIMALRDFQMLGYELLGKPRTFKQTPPGFNKEIKKNATEIYTSISKKRINGGETMHSSLFELFDNVITLDVETTGIDPKKDEIIELAAIRTEKGKGSADEFDLLVTLSKGRTLPTEITRLTGISESQLINEGVSKRTVCERIEAMLSHKNTLVVAYNAQFDLCFLYFLLKESGNPAALKNAKYLDALTVYKDRQPYPHKLSDAVAAYELHTQNTHRAIDDTRATIELMCAMEKEKDDLPRYVNLFGYNPRYGISGQRISSVKYVQQPYNAARKLYE